MNTKLTLSLDKLVISQAKQVAQKNKTSLSKIVESYLKSLGNDKPIEYAPITQKLIGIGKSEDNKKPKSSKDAKLEYLTEKYL